MKDETKMKAVLFDYDGVLTLHPTGSYSTCLYISNSINIDFNKVIKEYRKHINDVLYGKKSYVDIWDILCKKLNRNIDINILYKAFESTPLHAEMYNLIKNIKKSYKTALVTNNKKERMQILIKKQQLNTIFNTIVISADIGSDKKKPHIFTKVFHELQVHPHECIFIDNHEENLKMPAKMGVKTIFFNHGTDTVESLKRKLDEYKIRY